MGAGSKLFESVDKGGSGFVSRKELAAKVNAAGELEALMDIADALDMRATFNTLQQLHPLALESDGTLSRDEFDALLEKATPPQLLALKSGLSDIGVVGGTAIAYTRCSVQGKGLASLEGLQTFPHLRALDASSNALTAGGVGALSACACLTELSLATNSLADPLALPPLAALQALDLSSNALTSPANLSSLSALTSLDLSSNQVATVAALGSAPRLLRLRLGSNQLSAATGLAASAPALTSLDLSGNSLAALDGLSPLPQLTSLNLAKNGLKSLGGLAVEGLPALVTLDLSGNLLQALEELAPLASLPLLTELKLPETPLVGPVEGVEDVTPLDNCRVELLVLLDENTPRTARLQLLMTEAEGEAAVTPEDREAAKALKLERDEAAAEAKAAAEAAAAEAAAEAAAAAGEFTPIAKSMIEDVDASAPGSSRM